MDKLKKYKQKYGKIAIMISTKDRPTELYGLLQSLRTQYYNLFDIFLLDDGSSTPIIHYYFIDRIIKRMRIEGHEVRMYRNNISMGVSKVRQYLVDKVMENDKKYKLLCRIDDDSLSEPDYLEKLIDVIEKGYDLASGVVPFVGGPDMIRDVKFVSPIINYCEFNDKGNLIYNGDDCGIIYNEDKILLTPHFRSSCLYKRELHEAGVDYKSPIYNGKHGFREEQFFSFKAIQKGFKLGVHTNAINFHLITPSGGERTTTNQSDFNQKCFVKKSKEWYDEYGDFISKYYADNNLYPKKMDKLEYLKSTNLV